MATDWIAEHDRLNAAFESGSVYQADQRELQRLLLATSETEILSEKNRTRNQHRASILKSLLANAQTERVSRRSMLLSMAAIVVAIVSAVIAGIKASPEIKDMVGSKSQSESGQGEGEGGSTNLETVEMKSLSSHTNAEAQPEKTVTPDNLGHSYIALGDGTLVYGPDAKIELLGNLFVSSPTGKMRSNGEQTLIYGDLVVHDQGSGQDLSAAGVIIDEDGKWTLLHPTHPALRGIVLPSDKQNRAEPDGRPNAAEPPRESGRQ